MRYNVRHEKVTAGSKHNCEDRKASGQAIVEGTAMLVMITAIVVGLIFFIANLGMTMVYNQKVTFLANQAATYYSAQANGWNYQNTGGQNVDIDAYVDRMASSMGLPRTSFSATVEKTDQGVSVVTVTGKRLPLLQGSFLPGFITVSQTAAADSNVFPRPTGLMSFCVTGTSVRDGSGRVWPNPTVLIPVYSGLCSNDQCATRATAPEAPSIPGPGMYDQFSFSAPSNYVSMSYTAGNRHMKP
jgi:hypothetical protein